MTSGQPHASRFTVELKQAAEQQGKLTFQAEARRGLYCNSDSSGNNNSSSNRGKSGNNDNNNSSGNRGKSGNNNNNDDNNNNDSSGYGCASAPSWQGELANTVVRKLPALSRRYCYFRPSLRASR